MTFRLRRVSRWRLVSAGLIVGIASQCVLAQPEPPQATYDVVFANGRVIDPESSLDAIRNVGLKEGKIAAISTAPLKGKTAVDATGLIVAPGFIDWHSHGQNILSDRVHAFDGVTTALEFEMGMLPVATWYALQAQNGRALNYGASSSWAIARVATLEGIPLPDNPSPEWAFDKFRLHKWPNDVATKEQVDRIVDMAERGLKEGGIGIGLVPGYAPGSGYKELLAMQALATRYGVPTYSHVRAEGDVDPLSAAQAYGEMISLAAATGGRVHICHLNSTSFGDIGVAVRMIESAQRLGAKITVEAYPYAAASTGIGAAVLAPDNLARAGMTYGSIEYNGVRLNEKSFKELRAKNPGATVVVHFYELPRDQKFLDMSDSPAASSRQIRCHG